MGIGITELQRPELGLALGQLLQRRRQLGRPLHRADHRQLIDGDTGIRGMRQQARDREAVALQLIEGHLEVDVAGVGWVCRNAPAVGPLRRPLGGADGVRDAKCRERRLG